MATFVFKVFTLAIRTASKPLASRFQSYVLAHPTLRPAVLRFAQGIHQLDFAMTRFAEGKPIGTSKKFLGALDDDRAMDLAGKVVAVGVLAWEYNRNTIKDAAKKEKDEAFRKEVNHGFAVCHQYARDLAEQNRALMQAILERQEGLERRLSEFEERKQKKASWGLGWA